VTPEFPVIGALLTSILLCLGCCSKLPWTEWLINIRNAFSHGLQARTSKIKSKVVLVVVSGESCFLTDSFLVTVTTPAEGTWCLSGVSFIIVLTNPIYEGLCNILNKYISR
jgi:hypothetical protein